MVPLLFSVVALLGCDDLGWDSDAEPDGIPGSSGFTCLETGGETGSFSIRSPCFDGSVRSGDTQCLVRLSVRDGSGRPSGLDIVTGRLLLDPPEFRVDVGETDVRTIRMTSLGRPSSGTERVFVMSQVANCRRSNPDDCRVESKHVVDLLAPPLTCP